MLVGNSVTFECWEENQRGVLTPVFFACGSAIMFLLNPYLSSVSSQSLLSFVHKLTRRSRDLPVLAIRSCSLSAGVAYLADSLAGYSRYSVRAHHLGIPRTGREKRGGVSRRTTLLLFSQIVCSKYSAGGGAVSFTRLKMSYVVWW